MSGYATYVWGRDALALWLPETSASYIREKYLHSWRVLHIDGFELDVLAGLYIHHKVSFKFHTVVAKRVAVPLRLQPQSE